MDVEGACHCGRIRFRARVDPSGTTICHCTDCQQLSGSAFRVTVPGRASDFELLQGVPRQYVKTAESGRKRVHGFCEECGTPIYATSPGDDEDRMIGVRVGTLVQRDEPELRPKRQIWFRSRMHWIPDLPGDARDRH